MGVVYLELSIENIKDPERQQELSFLVDTRSTRAWISKEIAEAIGIEPAGAVPLELADGSIKELPYGFCLFVYDGEIVAGNVVIGSSQCEPIVVPTCFRIFASLSIWSGMKLSVADPCGQKSLGAIHGLLPRQLSCY